MKKLFLILLSVISLQIVNGQNCYQKLTDVSGIDHSASQSQIESAACELRDSLPSNFQNGFNVYDGGFYIHMEHFNGFGYPEGFEKLKQDATSPYYLLVGKQNESRGLYTRFWVDVKLPDITSDGCIPNLNAEASNLVEYVLEREFNKSGRSHYSYPSALITAIEALNEYISNAKVCCQNGGDVAQCIECNNPDNIAAKLLSWGFVQENIQNIGDYSGSTNFPPEIVDHANLLFTVNNLTAVDIPASYIDQIPVYQAKGLTTKIYITKDENVCTSVWQTIQDEIENSPADVIFWHHIHKGKPNQLGDEKLFTRVYLGGEGSNMRENGQRLQGKALGPDPVTAIIGALGAAFSDAMIQTVSIYFLSDDIDEGDWGEAFDRINYVSVAWSGFSGLFIVNKKMVTVALAVGDATVEVTYNAYNNPDYTMEQGALDFGRVFVSELIGSAVGGAVGNKLKNVNLSWFSGKALSKLKVLFGNSNASKRVLIKLCWKLEVENITTHTARGANFENWLFEWLFGSQGFIQTVHNFKGIDFHRASDNLGVSLKTTIQKSKSGLKSLIKKNIEDLQQAKVRGSITFQNTTFDIDEAKLLILVPEENVSTVTQKIQEIISELDPNGLIDVVEVNSFENLLGL